MNKKDFIQRMVIACKPRLDNRDAAIHYAENVWSSLSAAGYGDAKPGKRRESIDHYSQLTEYQKEWFDRFWSAFNLKMDKQGACISWIKLGELDKSEYQKIIDAAKAEALRPRRKEETRIYAQGWLSQRRFDDYDQPATVVSGEKEERTKLRSELNALLQFQLMGDDQFDDRIEELNQLLGVEK